MTCHQPALIPPATPTRRAATDRLRLTVFNVQHASPARARQQVAWLATCQDADVVVLTEVGAGPGAHSLHDSLWEHGYHSLITPVPDPARDYRTILASRGPALEPVDSLVTVLPHRAPAAAMHIGSTRLLLVGLYVPSRGPRQRRNVDKRAFQSAVTTALPTLVGNAAGPVVVAGDLNVVEPGHIPHHAVFGAWEYDFYRSFAAAGLVDAYRHLHPEAAEHSWYGRGGNGYRFDHIFTTGNHQHLITGCGYLHQIRHDGLSDHAAMTLTLTLTLTLTCQT